jgi:thiamine-phosphate pyrophosphorylase
VQNSDRIHRVLDVNTNRALEALRVVEEHARFVLDSSPLARRVKALRHDLQRTLAPLAGAGIAARDVAGDVGRPEVSPDARERLGLGDVLAANLSRTKEALRALEEYAKLVSADVAVGVSTIRYAAYELEQALLAGPAPLGDERRVYVLLGSSPTRRPVLDQLKACLAGGIKLVQLREKGLDDRQLLELSKSANRLCEEAGAWLVINDRADIARLSGARGLHVGRGDLSVRDARRITGPGTLVGTSVHDASELEAALSEGADCVGIGTLFPSSTKPELTASGLALLEELAPTCPLPIFGIGGVTPKNAAQVVAAGAYGVAVSGAVLDAPDPAAVCRALIEATSTASRA